MADLGFQNRNSSGNFPFAAGGWSVVLIFEYPIQHGGKKNIASSITFRGNSPLSLPVWKTCEFKFVWKQNMKLKINTNL